MHYHRSPGQWVAGQFENTSLANARGQFEKALHGQSERREGQRVHNPADDYPPTRPNLATLLIAVALIVGLIVLVARSSLGV